MDAAVYAQHGMDVSYRPLPCRHAVKLAVPSQQRCSRALHIRQLQLTRHRFPLRRRAHADKHELMLTAGSSPSSTPEPDGSEASSSRSDDTISLEEDTAAASVQLDMPRRSRLLTFTCNKCGGTTTRAINPLAWDRGTVFVQCGECEVWHNIKDNLNIVDEIRYADEDKAAQP